MMEGWKEIALNEIGWFKGAGVNKLINTDEQPVYLVNYMDVYKHWRIFYNTNYQEVTAKDREIEEANLLECDVLFTPSSEKPIDIGHAGVVMETMPNCVYSYHLIRLRLYDKTQFDLKFLSYLLNSDEVQKHFVSRASGSGIRYTLSLSDFKSAKIRFPEKHEQSTIAAILSKVDEAIAAVQGSMAAAERLKKSLMQNLLTGRMKPDGTLRTEEEFYLDEKFGRVPVGWEVKRIDEIAERKTEVIDPTKTKEVYDYIGLEHIVPDEFVRCGKGLSNETIALKVKFEKGDLLYGKLRPYLNKVFISDISGVGSTEFIVLKQNEFTNWIYLNFQLRRFLDYTKSMTAGTQHPRASWKDIKHYLVGIPKDNQEREQITKKLLSLEQHKTTNNNKIAVLERLKKSLMQNLLTGKVRIRH